MLEFEIIQEIKPNNEILDIIKNYTFTTRNDEKVNYVIDMIKDMDIENRLRLAICMCDNYSHTNLEYDKKEIYNILIMY